MESLKESQKSRLTKHTKISEGKIKRLIHGAMSRLSPEDYFIIYELYFNHTSIHQLARKLGVSRATVRRRRSKAIRNLKEMILKRQVESWIAI